MPSVILAPTLELARVLKPAITIEAEYGSHVVEGSVYTAAHHQPTGKYSRAESPSPCNNKELSEVVAKEPLGRDSIILISHFDLDTVGGCLRAMSITSPFAERNESFWALAEFVDLNGPHKLCQANAYERDIRRLWSYWAWSKQGRKMYSRNDLTDVTVDIVTHLTALYDICLDDERILVLGDEHREEESMLDAVTYAGISDSGNVISRRAKLANQFCNHLYRDARAVASLNDETGAVTISLADPVAGVNCKEIVQDLWGSEAGGHAGIAGSPRGKVMSLIDLHDATVALDAAIDRALRR